ncbi:guanine nucleotide binding protein, alpha subunit [Ephemerocybe angulata]|uniref:Guanine nucleotide binding protein, alpha subunit n=1 Tax=Ephemerocybe angulata TaxID=980116 RepID=A0A8H6HWS3_9AGAR|nr:guanine nucleotide binding protein, alpha subunit [Tulosesus angulatus]
MVLSHDDYDPFAVFTRAPANETPGERAARESAEAEAKKRSDAIDEELRKEKSRLKKEEKGVVKVLLLGQSESGKSTTLKNFRIKYAHAEWSAELANWRSVIQLNLLRSVITILDALQAEQDGEPTDDVAMSLYTPGPAAQASTSTSQQPEASSSSSTSRGEGSSSRTNSQHKPPPLALPRSRSSSNLQSGSGGASPASASISPAHQLLKLRLAPLRRVETDLKRRLGAGADEEAEDAAVGGGVLGNITNDAAFSAARGGAAGGGQLRRKGTKEFGVRRVKDALEGGGPGDVSGRGERRRGSAEGEDEATEVIASCCEDIVSLWRDEGVRALLRRRRIRLEDSAGFFLDDTHRIAQRTYTPSSDDVVRARLRTLGVQEYRIKLDSQSNKVSTALGNAIMNFGNEWLLYDVGGSRTGRNAWIPFFEGVNAIIFLAPLSTFDERLLEDSRINRLEDSFLLWRTVCSSPLLANASLILFMNKCDLLKRKLKAGVRVARYLPSYGTERGNDAGTVVKYLKDKFKDIQKTASTGGRAAYYYATSVTDTRTTAITLVAVKDIILRDHLKNADFV